MKLFIITKPNPSALNRGIPVLVLKKTRWASQGKWTHSARDVRVFNKYRFAVMAARKLMDPGVTIVTLEANPVEALPYSWIAKIEANSNYNWRTSYSLGEEITALTTK